jgi:hypothetical protein
LLADLLRQREAGRWTPTRIPAAAHTAVAKVLSDRYGIVVDDDGRRLLAKPACRTQGGDPCTITHSDRISPNTMGPGTFDPSIRTGSYEVQIGTHIAGDDGDVQIQVDAQTYDGHRVISLGASDQVDWLPHEVDEMRVAIDRELASP